MDAINELELRRALGADLTPGQLTHSVVQHILDPSLAWDDKRSFWIFLFASGREATLIETAAKCLRAKSRVPFDLIIHLCSQKKIKPTAVVVASLLKGIRKQRAQEELLTVEGWDAYDTRIALTRTQLREQKLQAQIEFKAGLLEKFHFLQSQRMTEQAGRTLRKMVELYPADAEFKRLKDTFDEHWAREVLSNHLSTFDGGKIDRTLTDPSVYDEEMLKCFLRDGESLSVEKRAVAADLAIAFWFMGDYSRGLEILNWADTSAANDWLKAEMLLGARHFIDALEWLNILEVKYSSDPESTFAVSYLRAQALKDSGQSATALEILQSIVRVRPNYRSTNALLQEWMEGATWE